VSVTWSAVFLQTKAQVNKGGVTASAVGSSKEGGVEDQS
jgi:hypothetical protein